MGGGGTIGGGFSWATPKGRETTSALINIVTATPMLFGMLPERAGTPRKANTFLPRQALYERGGIKGEGRYGEDTVGVGGKSEVGEYREAMMLRRRHSSHQAAKGNRQGGEQN